METQIIHSMPAKRGLTFIGLKALLSFGVLLILPLELRAEPTDANDYIDQISHSGLLRGSLVWVGQKPPSQAESQELWTICGKQDANFADVVPDLQAFVNSHPDSPWTPSLHNILGEYYRRTGYDTLALQNWQAAWDATRQMTDIKGEQVADYTLVEWLQLLSSLGRTETMKELFVETQNRPLRGTMKQLYLRYQGTYLTMLKHPELSYRCGTYALWAVAQVLTGTNYFRQIFQQPSPPTGFSMAALSALAQSNHLDMTAVKRPAGDESLVVPSVVHWKQNHYAAIIAKNGDMYKVVDPTFRMDQWLQSDVINTESSGDFLVPTRQIPQGWRRLTQPEMAHIFGKGLPSFWDPEPCYPSTDTDSCSTCGGPGGSGNGGGPGGSSGSGPRGNPGSGCTTCGGGGGVGTTGGRGGAESSGNSPGGMPTWTVMEPWCHLWLQDEPLAYQPATGTRISFKLSYQPAMNADWSWSWGNADINYNPFFSPGQNWVCSWLSYVDSGCTTSNGPYYGLPYGFVTLYAAGGGVRSYDNWDGTVPELYSNSRMLRLTNSSGTTLGFQILYPSGAKDLYEQVWPVPNDYLYALSQQIDPRGRATTFIYDTNVVADNDILVLKYVIDADGKTNTLSYTSIGNSALISQVSDPYGHHVSLNYDTYGELTNIVDVAGFSSSFGCDGNNNVTNLITPYGTNLFYYGQLMPWFLYCVVTEPNDSHQMFIYCGQIGDETNVWSDSNALPSVYTDLTNVPTNRPPDNLSGGNTLDNPDWNDSSADDSMEDVNSFYWGRQQFDNLSSQFMSTGTNWNTWNFLELTTNDLACGRLRHWLQNSGTVGNLGMGNVLSMEREPSPDNGITSGKMTWYDYPGKPYYDIMGTSAYPSMVIKVLPDGTEWYTVYQVDQFGNRTNVVSTYSINGTTLTRTNRYVYSTNGLDLLLAIGPDGVTNAAYGYDSNHQVLFMTNALREVTSYSYNANEQLTSVTQPNGLVTTYNYGANGYLTNQIVTGFSTNSYTYTNGLVYSHTDERGLTLTNSWDALERLTNVAYPDGTISYIYSNLDLAQVIDRMGHTNSYSYNSIRQKVSETDASGRTTHYVYCDCGALYAITNALNQATVFTHDNQGNLIDISYPDSYSVTNTYNSIRQLTQRADTSGAVLSYAYNNQGLETSVSNTVGLAAAYTYDIRDRLTNSVDANGVSVGMTYDNLDRLLTSHYPDNGVEKFGYTPNLAGLTSYTNRIGSNVVTYAYDGLGRKTNEVYVGVTTNNYAYDGAGELMTLTDGKGNPTTWRYDQYGRVTNKVDASAITDFIYKYDADNRLTNRWSANTITTTYGYDAVGNLISVNYSGGISTPSLSFTFDALNHLTNMVDGIGTTAYSYDAAGQMLSEAGPWTSDTESYTYTNRLRTGLSLSQPSGSWSQSYGYDSARRLTNIISLAGNFGYQYLGPSPSTLVTRLALPNGAYITNGYDSVARLLSTALENSSNSNLDSYAYGYNLAGQRTNVTRTFGDYVNYAYDNEGELTSAIGKAAGGTTNRWQEHLGYAYDAAGNLNYRTNNGLLGAFSVNDLNELTTVTNGGRLTVAGTTTTPATSVTVNASNAILYADATFASTNQPWTNGNNTYTAAGQDSYGRVSSNSVTVNLQTNIRYTYDTNGNLTSDGTRGFTYDDENQLVGVWVANSWSNSFAYDGKMRRRIEKDYTCQSGTWVPTNETHFIYDGNVVIQERNAANAPLVTYTRGNDLSRTLQGAGGIGGLLARTDYGQEIPGSPTTAYYHADANGNITMLIYNNQIIAAKYLYDPFGNTLSMSGSLADLNNYRFSSKEWNGSAGLYYYLYRYYDPMLQRWPNRDPLGDVGSLIYISRNKRRDFDYLLFDAVQQKNGINLYEMVGNDPLTRLDYLGLLTEKQKAIIDIISQMADAAADALIPGQGDLDAALKCAGDPCVALGVAASYFNKKYTECIENNLDFNGSGGGDPCAKWSKAKDIVENAQKKNNCP